MTKKKHKKVIFNFIVYIILLFILVYSGIKIFKWYKDKTKSNKIAEQIKETVMIENEDENEGEYTIDFKKLKEQNNETVAWIKVNNTNIEYPVVKAKNNDFYLNHCFDKSPNLTGWIFADYRNKFDGTDKNIIIYGHNIKDDSMFGSLKWVINADWYNNEDNKYITLITENEPQVYEVFSVYQIEKEDYYIQTNFNTEKEFNEFAQVIKKRSKKEFYVDVNEEDSILTLSTCANNDKYRIVLHAKKIIEK